MKAYRRIYRIVRSVILTAILFVAALYVCAYLLLSVPSVQRGIRDVAVNELSARLGCDISVGSLMIYPFNEAVLIDVNVPDPDGRMCVHIDRVGAGINIWRLLSRRRIELTYAEIMGLRARIVQPSEGAPLNIQFIIDAFRPKEPGKPPTRFDLKIHSIIIRRGTVSFDRAWLPRKEGKIDFNHLRLEKLTADVALPCLKNDDFIVDLRRLSFTEQSGFDVRGMKALAHITPEKLSVDGLTIELPGTYLSPADMKLSYDGYKNIGEALRSGNHSFFINDGRITPADFSAFVPALGNLDETYSLTVEADGNMKAANLRNFRLTDRSGDLIVELKGRASGFNNADNLKAQLEWLRIGATSAAVRRILGIAPLLSGKALKAVSSLGDISIEGSGELRRDIVEGKFSLSSSAGDLNGDATLNFGGRRLRNVVANVKTNSLNLGSVFDIPKLGASTFSANANLKFNGKYPSGIADISIDAVDYGGKIFSGIHGQAMNESGLMSVKIESRSPEAAFVAEAQVRPQSKLRELNANIRIRRLNPGAFGLAGKYKGYILSGAATASLSGANIDELHGEVSFSDLSFLNSRGKGLELPHLRLMASGSADEGRSIRLRSTILDADFEGNYRLSQLPATLKSMAYSVMPAIMPAAMHPCAIDPSLRLDYRIRILNTAELADFFNLPVRQLVEMPMSGSIDGSRQTASFAMNVPYLQMGRDKLVRNTTIRADIDAMKGEAALDFASLVPGKDGEIDVKVGARAAANSISTDIGWDFMRKKAFRGNISFTAGVLRNLLTGKPEIALSVNPSTFSVNDSIWRVDKSSLFYSDKMLDVRDLRVWHGNQFVDISGRASASANDSIHLRLRDIDLGYVFETLRINYVNFGGAATGDVYGTSLFSKSPVATTDNLHVSGFAYNGSEMGDAIIRSYWDNARKGVHIHADISEQQRKVAIVDGGVFVTRDSLDFTFDTDRVRIGFMRPFMEAFCSGVSGRASGKVRLYGNFSDIDMEGDVVADTIAMHIDYTNVTYSASHDTIHITPGRITIPELTLYDPYGNTALMSGVLTHRYFHEPSFRFIIRDARNLLCYNTDERINPVWYGRIFGSGSGTVTGRPGLVSIAMNMTTGRNSVFTFVLDDTETAEDYPFLTFTDRRKEMRELEKPDTTPDIEAMFRKKLQQQADNPSAFKLDLHATVTPAARLIIVMDPIGGDRIRARGNGAIQMGYSSETDELTMYGKYTLEEGNYNFTLQDIIIKDFTIRPGSSIAFNGDPLHASLDIEALYRVNANLSDLDKSFSTDRDLNRTNVPVDAVLKVDGDMEHPDISFDVELPTLTSDVTRKVKSIISTDDMMNRQVLYLLALNRFYTPDYMGVGSNGGELASVASSTLSSQLANILGQLSDTWTFAPSFRSDRGDFKDVEVDLALSSRLLNNRLLLNGNFGYRDRSTSSTTFVGDFDIEYLLTRSGNLRLKAYNHYNDQNYYLKSALTTQGLGVVYKHDFNNLFSWLKRKKKNETEAAGKKGKEGKEKESKEEKERKDTVVRKESDGLLEFK